MVWDLWSGKMVCICKGAGGNDFFVTADNHYLISNSTYVVKVWGLETGVEVYINKVTTRKRGRIISLNVTSDNRVIIGSENGQLYCLQLPETL
ncbi:MAG: hypothetical protein GY797_33345 [Deltaproteobacteria bacterium]|nr:hypothetical protein [Deltaproteobacteria bacterium]